MNTKKSEKSSASPACPPPSHEPLGATIDGSDAMVAAVGVDPTGVAAVAQKHQRIIQNFDKLIQDADEVWHWLDEEDISDDTREALGKIFRSLVTTKSDMEEIQDRLDNHLKKFGRSKESPAKVQKVSESEARKKVDQAAGRDDERPSVGKMRRLRKQATNRWYQQQGK